MSEPENNAVADAAKKIADAATAKAEAVADVAESEADAAKADAAETIVAAATGAAALAEVQSAKAKVDAATEIDNYKGDLSWIKSNQETMGSSLNEQRQTISAIAEQTGKLTEMVSQLLTPPKQTEKMTGEPPIANPQNAGQEDHQTQTPGEAGTKPKPPKSKPASQAKSGRLWT